jgi:cytochrome c biogenesis protein ResB
MLVVYALFHVFIAKFIQLMWLQDIYAVHFECQVFLGFPVSLSKCSDGSQHSKLPLHASHVALPT